MSSDRFDDLFRHRKRLVADLIAFGCSEQDAHDLAQEALTDTWKRLDKVSRGAEWIYVRTAARRKAITLAIRNPAVVPLPELPDGARSPETCAIENDERERFQQRFNEVFLQLPDETRLIFVLKARGLTSDEIAAKLEMHPTAVRSRLSRAAKQIRERVGKLPPSLEGFEFPGDDDAHA